MGKSSSKIKNISDALFGTIKFLIKFKKSEIQPFIKSNSRLIILGNGPSLSSQMDKLVRLPDFDFLAVNYFACTEQYVQFKPSSYVIASPQYWIKDKQAEWNSTREKVFTCLLNKTDWEINLFVPVIAKQDKKWLELMSNNPKIKLNFINLSPIDGNPAYFNRFLKRFLVCPRPHNVLVPSLLCGINMSYRLIYLAGADHSWIPEISVTKKNDVLIAQKHFYGENNKNNSLLSDKAKPMYSPGSEDTFKLHQVLEKFFYSFKSYWILKEYASYTNVEVYNLLDSSYIDAFQKIDINDISS